MKKAILLVSFGTSYREARERSLECIYEDLRKAALQNLFYGIGKCSKCGGAPTKKSKTFLPGECAGIPLFYQAYTSKMILEKLSDRGISIYSVEKAVEEILLQGVECLVVVATHMIPGLEYQKMVQILEQYRGRFQRLAVTPAILQQEEDCRQFVPLLQEMLHFQKEYDYILMGHGTEDAANIRYRQMNDAFWEMGFENVQIASVEAEPGLEKAIQRLLERGAGRKVILHPFMVVAGDHANNDMAGDENSYLTRLQNLGYETEVVIKGLGEYPQFRKLYIDRMRKLLESM